MVAMSNFNQSDFSTILPKLFLINMYEYTSFHRNMTHVAIHIRYVQLRNL